MFIRRPIARPSTRSCPPCRVGSDRRGREERIESWRTALRHSESLAIGLAVIAAATLVASGQAMAQNLTQADNSERIRAELQTNAGAPAAATAGTDRRIPDPVRLGVLKLGVFPGATLDGKTVMLAPGFRLHDGLNRVVVPASVIGASHTVAYQRGPLGEVLTAWIVTARERDEIRRRQ